MARNQRKYLIKHYEVKSDKQLVQASQGITMKMKDVWKYQLLLMFVNVLLSASIDHFEDKHDQNHTKVENMDAHLEHIQKTDFLKTEKKINGKMRVLRKKKRTKLDVLDTERDGEEYYDSNVNDYDLGTEWREYPYDPQEVYHSHPHAHLHLHDTSSVYSKYKDLRPLNLQKLVPMLSLVSLYMLTPTFLNARRRRSSFKITADGDVLNEEDERYECFLRLACRVGELSSEIGVQSNPLIEELRKIKKFQNKVVQLKENNMCNTSGCEKILAPIE